MSEMIVQVRNKILRRIGGVNHFVSHNKDYTIQFQFDDEWSSVRTKMAVFAYEDGEYGSEIFDGDTCTVPELPKEGRILIGIKAGEDLSTELLCIPVCKSADDVITDEYDEPDPKIYEQILDIINNLWGGGTTVYPSPVRFLAAPNKAEVGQFVRVKEVDENGEVKKTEAVDVEKELVVVNITEDSDGVLHADMTYDEINPLRYDHAVYAKWSSGMYPYSTSARMYFGDELKSVFVFSSPMAGTENWRIAIAQDGSVKISSYELELAGRKVQTVDETTGTGDDAEKNYPSAKAVYEALANVKDKDAVKFVEQDLTEDQKQQARENISALGFTALCDDSIEGWHDSADTKYTQALGLNVNRGDFPIYITTVGRMSSATAYMGYTIDGKCVMFYRFSDGSLSITSPTYKNVAFVELTNSDGEWLSTTAFNSIQEYYEVKSIIYGVANGYLLPLASLTNNGCVFQGFTSDNSITRVTVNSKGVISVSCSVKNFPVTITSTTTDGTTTYTADKTFDEIKVAYKSGANVYAMYHGTIIPVVRYFDGSGNNPDNSYIDFLGNYSVSRVSLIEIDTNENIEIKQNGAVPLYKWSDLLDVMYNMDYDYPINVICVSDSEAPDGGGMLFYSSGANDTTINYIMITQSGNYYSVSYPRRYQGTPAYSHKIASALPAVTISDNNKILQVTNGTWASSDFPIASSTVIGGVKPVAKTDSMTQEVGVDADGKLYTKPSSLAGGSISFEQDGDYISIISTGVTIVEEDGYITIS